MLWVGDLKMHCRFPRWDLASLQLLPFPMLYHILFACLSRTKQTNKHTKQHESWRAQRISSHKQTNEQTNNVPWTLQVLVLLWSSPATRKGTVQNTVILWQFMSKANKQTNKQCALDIACSCCALVLPQRSPATRKGTCQCLLI